MTQTSNRLFDEFAKLMTDAAGVAQGVRREVETGFRAQAERFLSDMDIVSREEFEAVKEMAANARDAQAKLEARVAELEAKLAAVAKPAKPARPKAGTKPADKS
ncbi:accessory factor UbiK family protein [Breoghania sp. L-A4]|uniref:accessory factor UbiK family protein n=1 Tax=Breoghania sp. L-A4 TaxID=2304600 RepID=UPI000E35D943|nr:accessory factor UbiK family protein [Breoghania sp. L-A4]AXS41448.1 pyrroline-5-carboxylate reductase [Breoghania sp. L-A4]